MFENVKIVKKANVYFGGKVTSRTVLFEDGVKKTLGFMISGEYEFNTGVRELMEILGGEAEVMVAGTDKYLTFKEGDSFSVPENSSFKLIIKDYCDYCCSYGD